LRGPQRMKSKVDARHPRHVLCVFPTMSRRSERSSTLTR
jgi:hypothetical protein